MVEPWIAIIVAVSLAPMGVRLAIVRRARQPVLLFDDVVAYFGQPLLWVGALVPLSAIAKGLAFGVAGAILLVALWRSLRDYQNGRADRRVDGPPAGR